jgi:hypothetical protein
VAYLKRVQNQAELLFNQITDAGEKALFDGSYLRVVMGS